MESERRNEPDGLGGDDGEARRGRREPGRIGR